MTIFTTKIVGILCYSCRIGKKSLLFLSLWATIANISRSTGKMGLLLDRCPHRLAKLSTGQMIAGRLECLYHGWQFETDGKCSHIPQLPVNTPIPRNAKVKSYGVVERQGVLWVWLGEEEQGKKAIFLSSKT